jgi:hypothetical protein
MFDAVSSVGQDHVARGAHGGGPRFVGYLQFLNFMRGFALFVT